MKNILTAIVFVCLSTTLISTSCKKDKKPAGATAVVTKTFTVKINNADVGVKSTATKVLKGVSNKNYVQIIATLLNDDIAYVEIFYNDVTQNAVLDVSKDFKGDFGYQSATNANGFYEASENIAGSSGNITVTKNDLNGRKIQGTFSGIAVNSGNPSDKKSITNGSFAVSY